MKALVSAIAIATTILAAGCSKEQGKVPPEEGIVAVDMGLSVKWASCNLDATKMEEHGGYYQWAGTRNEANSGKNLDWGNCPYHTGTNSEAGWTKYVSSKKPSYWSGPGSPDNKAVLDQTDDIAHIKLGGKWRMPTRQEWEDLRSEVNCKWSWTDVNGVYGYEVTSQSTGKSIFLPAAGYRHFEETSEVGEHGYYWSSTVDDDTPYYTNDIDFDRGDYGAGLRFRYCGESIRPVLEK